MKNLNCISCGGPIPFDRPRGTSPLCSRDECWKTFCIRWVDSAVARGRLVDQDQCFVWVGHRRKSERNPRIRLRDSFKTWRQMRVIDAVRLHRGLDVNLEQPVVSDVWCGTYDCQNPDHHTPRYQIEVDRNARKRPVGHLDLSRVKLPFEPLLRMTNELRARYPEMEPEYHMVWQIPKPYQKLYDRSYKSGKISVLDADAYCCDVLEMHPTSVYGWDFYTVGEEVA